MFTLAHLWGPLGLLYKSSDYGPETAACLLLNQFRKSVWSCSVRCGNCGLTHILVIVVLRAHGTRWLQASCARVQVSRGLFTAVCLRALCPLSGGGRGVAWIRWVGTSICGRSNLKRTWLYKTWLFECLKFYCTVYIIILKFKTKFNIYFYFKYFNFKIILKLLI